MAEDYFDYTSDSGTTKILVGCGHGSIEGEGDLLSFCDGLDPYCGISFDREDIPELISILQHFYDHGELPKERPTADSPSAPDDAVPPPPDADGHGPDTAERGPETP